MKLAHLTLIASTLLSALAMACASTPSTDSTAAQITPTEPPSDEGASGGASSSSSSSGASRTSSSGGSTSSTSSSGGSSSGGSSSGGPSNKSCTQSACTVGGPLSFCTTTTNNQCSGAEYTHDGNTFTCDSCTDCSAAAQAATADCIGDNTSSSGGSSSGGTPTETCSTVGTSCAAGGDLSYCYTYVGSTCTNAVYKAGGKTFTCASCTDCNDAYGAAYVTCQDAVGGCNDLASCCSSMPAAYQPSCQSTYDAYQGQAMADAYCKSAYDSYRQSNLCP